MLVVSDTAAEKFSTLMKNEKFVGKKPVIYFMGAG